METTVNLSIFSQGETYIFSLESPTDSPLSPQQTIHPPLTVGGETKLNPSLRSQLDQAITDAVEQQRMGNAGPDAARSLERLGRLMFNFIVPSSLQTALRNLPSEWPIILTTNDTKLPWELLHDGTQYLALKHSVSRRLWSTKPVRQQIMPNKIKRLFLFISNPRGDLDEADLETNELMDIFDSEVIAGAYPTFLARSRASKWNVLQALGEPSDLIHYSGHAEPGTLLLSDGQLTTQEIEKSLVGQPFVFLNACSSVRQAKQSDVSAPLSYPALTVESLAEAFIMGGAVGFIGTLWPVFDHSSREFAESFYTHVHQGLPVGEALRQTRVQMHQARPNDPIWASFVFYGDPWLTIADPVPHETRSVTVLVARLEGLFALFEAHDLETAIKIREQAIARLKKVSLRYQGHSPNLSTDRLTVYFGVPAVHGNEAQLAIHAAFDMIRALRAFNQQLGISTTLSLRVGISTGRMLVRTAGANYQIVGHMESVAGRLADLADIGQIMVDQATSRAARLHFAFEPLELLGIVGGRPSMAVYHAVDAKADQASMTEFVGRERELTQLREYWREAATGRGCVVGIVGDSGVGKTRLVQAFQDEMAVYDHRWISVSCQSYEKSKTYGLLGQIIGALADFNPHDDEAARLRKLEQVVRMTDTGQLAEADIKEGVAFLSHLVGIPFSVPMVESQKKSEQWQMSLRWIVASVVESQCVRQPIVLALDNLQWADEASLTVLNQVIHNVAQLRLLLLATYQSEWSHEWQNQLDYKPMRLQELPEEAQKSLLANLLGMEPSEELEQVILSRTGGNPFFVEEFVLSLQEDGFLTRSNDVWVPATDLTQAPLPDNVEAAIQARLDRLEEASRKVMQRAAVIGQKFENTVLEEIQDKSKREQLNQALSSLTKRNLILRMPGWRPPIFYTFSHGLVHEIVYRLLPERFRQGVHRRIAQALRRVYQNNEEQILHRLADHYHQSSDRVNAIRYCLRAARSDAEKWANREALGWYDCALQKLDTFDEKPLTEAEAEQMDGVTPVQLIAWQVEALSGKGDVEALSGEWQRALDNYLQAESLIYEVGWQPGKRADLMRRIGRQHGWGGEFDKGLEWMERGRKLLEADGNDAEGKVLALIDFHSASIFNQKGQFAQAEVLCQRGLSLLSQKDDPAVRAEGHNLLGTAQDMQGKYDAALDAYQTSIALWQEVGNKYQVKRVENNVAIIHSLRGDWREAREVYLPVLAFFEKVQDRNRLAVICTSLGLLEYLAGEYEVSAQRQQRAIELADEVGVQWVQAPARVNLAWVHVARGEWQQAELLARKSIAIETEHKSKHSLPEAYRVLAEVALGRGQLDPARDNAQTALNLALEQSNRLEEGTALRVLGQVERLAKNGEVATSHLESSLKIFGELHNRFEAARTERQLACLKREMEEQATALGHAIRALTVFVKMGAKGEADSMKAENELTFHLQRSGASAAALCRTEMAAVGWTESSSASASVSNTTDDNRMSLEFRHQSHHVVISLTADTKGTIVTLGNDHLVNQ